MKIFFSAKENTFFRDDFHGTRTIFVYDPEWVRPKKEIQNPEWHEGNEDVPETILVDDMSAVWPEIEVRNPNCLLPPENELVEMTMDEFMEIQNLIATVPLSVISSDKSGRPIVIPYPGQTPEQILAGARQKRDWLLSYATLRINPLQDDVDNGESTPESEALLKSWKQYRSAVNKTQDKPDWPTNPQWPEPPVPLETATSEAVS